MGGRSSAGGNKVSANAKSVASKATAERTSLTQSELSQAQKSVDKMSFQKTGNGVWEISGPYTVGAQILDETGSSRAIRMGYGTKEKLYSVNTWGQNVEDTRTTYFTRLSDAKTAAKEEVKEWLKSVKKSRNG